MKWRSKIIIIYVLLVMETIKFMKYHQAFQINARDDAV